MDNENRFTEKTVVVLLLVILCATAAYYEMAAIFQARETEAKRFLKEYAESYDYIGASVVDKKIVEYDTELELYNDEQKGYAAQNTHIVKADYVVLYDYNDETHAEKFSTDTSYTEVGSDVDIYVEKGTGKLHRVGALDGETKIETR